MIISDHYTHTGFCRDLPLIGPNPANIYWIINGPDVKGKGWPEGTLAASECNIGKQSRILYHPTVCQPNGTWEPPSTCESKRSCLGLQVTSVTADVNSKSAI